MAEIVFAILCVIFVFCALVGSHEFGHLIAAKIFGIKARVYSIGFGPKLLGLKLGETEYRISLIPFGGYVKILNKTLLDSEGDERDPRTVAGALESKPRWQQMIVFAAGGITNIAFAALIFFFVAYKIGFPSPTLQVQSVMENSPAKEAGIKENDVLVSIDGRILKDFSELIEKTNDSKGKEIVIGAKRGTESLSFKTAPKLSPDGKRWLIGIEMITEKIALNFSQSAASSAEMTLFFIGENLKFLKKVAKRIYANLKRELNYLIFGIREEAPKNQEDLTRAVAGPVGIFSMLYKFSQKEFGDFLYFAGMLCVCIGFLNLLPIPVLDGGYILFLAIEIIIRRPLNEKVREFCMTVGIILLVCLLILGIRNDFSR